MIMQMKGMMGSQTKKSVMTRRRNVAIPNPFPASLLAFSGTGCCCSCCFCFSDSTALAGRVILIVVGIATIWARGRELLNFAFMTMLLNKDTLGCGPLKLTAPEVVFGSME